MNKTKNFVALSLAVVLFGVMPACQKPAANNTINNKPATENKPATNANQSVNAATPATTDTTTSPAGSPTEAYKAAHAARKNKDIAGLKKLMSKDVLEFLTMVGEADEKKKLTLDEQLKQLCDAPQAATAEARNEAVSGDTAILEYLDEKGEWKTMEFVKEGGFWKIAFGGPKGEPEKGKDTKKK